MPLPKPRITQSLAIAATALAAMLGVPASAQDAPGQSPASVSQDAETPLDERAHDLVRLLNDEADPEALFASNFLAAIPVSQIKAITRQLTGQYGPAIAVETIEARSETAALVTIRMERGLAAFSLSLDPNQANRINGLRVEGVTPTGDSLDQISEALGALPGEVSAYFGPLTEEEAVLAINPAQQNPLGSTMKLYVLAQLGREVAAGERDWSDVVQLDRKSFPSGKMQDWPEGAPVTLHTLASMMISISDNTATDALIRLLGEEALASILEATGHSAPQLNAPWLTTREFFLLKAGEPAQRDAYIAGPEAARARILAGLEDNPASARQVGDAFSGPPVALDIEYFASARDLASLLRFMRAECDPEVFAIMAINPGIPREALSNWDYVGYKGGSEPGVLNVTWLLRDKAGEDHMLSLNWVNREESVAYSELEAIALRILSLPQ